MDLNQEKDSLVFYHIFNRGVEKRLIFQEDSDYFRFIHDLYEFNSEYHLPNMHRRVKKAARQTQTVQGTTLNSLNSLMPTKRDKLVDIVCFCLMPNHFHLILRSTKEGGITQFMKKLGTGYAMYFNKKYDRVGALFQGRFKNVFIESDEQFMHLSRYIHLNPVELIEPDWKERGVANWDKIENFLEKYRYSSYLDYIGIKNFPSVTDRGFLSGYFGSKEAYKNFVEEYTKENFCLVANLISE